MSNISANITGSILEAKTASFKDDSGVVQTYGKIQVLGPDMSGQFHQITNIKVRKEDFGFLPDIAAQKGKKMTLPLEQTVFNGKVSWYLLSSALPAPQAKVG